MTTLSTCIGDEIDQTTFGHADETQLQFEPLASGIECLCPFCGALNAGVGQPCGNCKVGETKTPSQAGGLWYVLQPDNPDAPGIGFKELLNQVRQQVVTSKSVVRGPATGQLYRLASKIRGLSREFGQCYSCAGDVETDETICPHCDRVQTVAEQAKPMQRNKETSASKQVRSALLNDPVVHVHSLSHPEHPSVDESALVRPVVAAHSARHVPKDDLLTPRDVAKAFQLEFGMEQDRQGRYFAQPSQMVRKIKIGLTSAASLAVAVAILWPLTHAVSKWSAINPARAATPAVETTVSTPAPTMYADARSSSSVSFDPTAQVIAPVVSETPNAPIATPTVASAVLTPTVQVDPAPASDPSPQDDPKLLWNAGMDAESAGNFAAAVQAYERIESLPSDSWPAGLQTRLNLARKELKGEVR